MIEAGDSGVRVPIHGPLPEGVLGEVRIHQQIYQRRSDISAVIRSMPMQVMSLSCAGLTPKLQHGMGAYFNRGVPLWVTRNCCAATRKLPPSPAMKNRPWKQFPAT